MELKAKNGGVRRYQNEDGTLTEEGKAQYKKFSLEDKYLYNMFSNTLRSMQKNHKKLEDKYKRKPNERTKRYIDNLSREINKLKKDNEEFLSNAGKISVNEAMKNIDRRRRSEKK